MKKTGIINRDVSALVAQMGHYDALMVSDAGFPIPHGVPCIDLSLVAGRPTVDDVVAMVAQELEVQQFHVADEAIRTFADRTAEIQALLPDASPGQMPHSDLKSLVAGARGVIRTGDYRPYANVVLISGVPY